jgi:hypothetical protein
MSADIISFTSRRDRKRRVSDFLASASPPDDLVMDHVDTAPCEVLRHCEEQSDEAIHLSPHAAPWIASRSLSSGARSRDPLARYDGWR